MRMSELERVVFGGKETLEIAMVVMKALYVGLWVGLCCVLCVVCCGLLGCGSALVGNSR